MDYYCKNCDLRFKADRDLDCVRCPDVDCGQSKPTNIVLWQDLRNFSPSISLASVKVGDRFKSNTSVTMTSTIYGTIRIPKGAEVVIEKLGPFAHVASYQERKIPFDATPIWDRC